MHNYKLLLFSGCVMFLVASISLLFSQPFSAYAGGEVCGGGGCSVSDTTLADFAQGSFYSTGLRNQFDGEVQLLPIGLSSQWVTDPHSLPGKRAELSAVIYRDIIYAIGGIDETGATKSEVFSATTLITGAISATGWTTPTNLPGARYGAAAVISPTLTGAFLYVIGGQTGSAVTSTIFYRPLDTNGNFTGSWLTTSITTEHLTVPPRGLIYAQAVVHNGFLYVIGGNDGYTGVGSNHNEIIRAPINLDGSITLENWTFDQSLPANRIRHASVVWTSGSTSDYLYVMGGQGASGDPTAHPEVYISSFSVSDTLTAFNTSAYPLPVPFYSHAAAQGNGEIFVTGGFETAITNSVQSALINADGELRGNWATSFPLPQGRAFHATVMNSGGEVYVIGGNSTGGRTDTVYHGSTSGTGSAYAPDGTFTSRIINLGAVQPLTSFVANTTITSTNPTTMTLFYRTATSQNALLTASWTSLGNVPSGENISTTYSLGSLNASHVQYRAIYTNTTPFNSSPTLNAFQINYPVPGDFLIGALPALQDVTHGQSVTFTTSLTATNGFANGVALNVSGLPAGASATFATNPITPTASTVLTVTTLSSVIVGTYPLSIIGTSGNLTHTASVVLSVNAGPDFSMVTVPSSQNVIQGQTGVYTSSLTALIGFTSSVTLTLSGLPPGANGTIATNPIIPTASTAITVTTLPTIAVASYPLTLTGNSGSITHTSTFTLNIVPPSDFLVGVIPSLRSITQGQSVTYTAQLTSVLGFNSPVTMTLSGLPSGASSIFGKNPITPTASTALTITTPGNVPAGVYLLTLTGNSGSITHNGTFTLSISPPSSAVLPDFRITSIQAPPAVGTAMTRTITITVINQGNGGYTSPARIGGSLPVPVLRQPTSVRKPLSSFSSPKVYTQTTEFFFWIVPVIDRISTGVSDVGNCVNQSGQFPQLPFVYRGDLHVGATRTVYANCWLPSGSHYFYARADICESPPDICSENYGRILEKDENNNVFGPVNSGNTVAGPTFFLPSIRR